MNHRKTNTVLEAVRLTAAGVALGVAAAFTVAAVVPVEYSTVIEETAKPTICRTIPGLSTFMGGPSCVLMEYKGQGIWGLAIPEGKPK